MCAKCSFLNESSILYQKSIHIKSIINYKDTKVCLRIWQSALAGVAQWIEHRPANQKGRWFDSQSRYMPGLQARSQQGA